MKNQFATNPHKAASKIQTNNMLIGVCMTIFGILWAFSPENLTTEIVLQFVFAIPLLYVSNLCYTKIAYWKEVRLWDYFGWFTGTTALVFVLNMLGVLTYFIGYHKMSILYFLTIWILLTIYTMINIYHNPKAAKIKIFKLLYFIILQLIFGLGMLYF